MHSLQRRESLLDLLQERHPDIKKHCVVASVLVPGFDFSAQRNTEMTV